MLRGKIIEEFPTHKVFTESFGGGGSILLCKPRAYSEIYNDKDDEVVNVFAVMRDPVKAERLTRMLRLTPFSRAEFELSYIPSSNDVEQARRTIVRSFMGFSSASITGKWRTGFRSNCKQSGTSPSRDWTNYPDHLKSVTKRLQGVIIESGKEASEIIKTYDFPEALHYVDPPYPFSTRGERWAGNSYRYEMTDNDHRDLASVLRSVEGMVIISGYACDLYDQELYPDWKRIEFATYADGAKKRTEVLWINDSCAKRKDEEEKQEIYPLFNYKENGYAN